MAIRRKPKMTNKLSGQGSNDDALQRVAVGTAEFRPVSVLHENAGTGLKVTWRRI
jgi:hypothetical protein